MPKQTCNSTHRKQRHVSRRARSLDSQRANKIVVPMYISSDLERCSEVVMRVKHDCLLPR